MINVLFVCLGNICRSPMAEAVFLDLVRQAGLQNSIAAESAGTGGWHIGSPAHPGTRDVLLRHGISYVGCGRALLPDDFHDFDYVVTMDDDNLAIARRMKAESGGEAELAPLLSYATLGGATEVPDPFYHGGFDAVFDLVYIGAQGLLRKIMTEHHI